MLNVNNKCVDLITPLDNVLNTPRLRNSESTFKIFERKHNTFL